MHVESHPFLMPVRFTPLLLRAAVTQSRLNPQILVFLGENFINPQGQLVVPRAEVVGSHRNKVSLQICLLCIYIKKELFKSENSHHTGMYHFQQMQRC